ncbi:MAG: hypothetical protein IPK99_02090 [Flavobacteriales bacterium]|nr:hypothetical protein [Flavobacteriales bacterium]
MPKKRFTEKDIEQLLGHYRSERRRLVFQLDAVRKSIKDLRSIKTTGSSSAGAPLKRGPGRPRKTDGPVRRGRKPGRKKKRTIKDGGYRLNPWDQNVINSIQTSGRLLPKQDLLTNLKKWAAKKEPSVPASEVEMRLTRALQKLSGKRGVLGTHRSGLQRGYHYGLKEWFFNTSGRLRRQHLQRLVLKK